jgi:hypothetical protein
VRSAAAAGGDRPTALAVLAVLAELAAPLGLTVDRNGVRLTNPATKEKQ